MDNQHPNKLNRKITVTSDEVVGMAKTMVAKRYGGSYSERLTENDVVNALSLERKFRNE